MRLEELNIQRLKSWMNKGEGFEGTLKTVSPVAEVTVKLDDEACRKILEIAAGAIREAGEVQAKFLVQEAHGLLELPND